jgi:ABC-type amino acid transport system permease subunit
MKNLPQFRNKLHENVRQYILQTKGVDIGSNFNWNNPIIWILIGLVALACGIGISKWWQQRQMKNEMESIHAWGRDGTAPCNPNFWYNENSNGKKF